MNTQLTGIEKTRDYALYHSPFIANYHKEIIKDCTVGHLGFKEIFKGDNKGTTWEYEKYNIFSITARSIPLYTIYRQIVAATRDFVGDDRPLWIQCWMNHHLQDKVLDWHFHENDMLIHGYVSIDPKNTVTEFTKYSIENRIGNIYLGKTGEEYSHRVVVREPYEGYRITLGFDIIDAVTENLPVANLSFIPIP